MIHHAAPVRRQEGQDERSSPGIRAVQVALAAFWAIDALLQLQPANFMGSLVSVTILGNAENQPQPIYGSLVAASRVLGPYYIELNIAIIAIQLLIAGGSCGAEPHGRRYWARSSGPWECGGLARASGASSPARPLCW